MGGWKQLAEASPIDERFGLAWLIAAAILTIVLWQIPFGDYILYPFTILATWFHEMAHGLAAMLLGGSFERLEIYGNGSGVAVHRPPAWAGSLGEALIAAAGPMGPPLAGALFLLCSRRYDAAHYSLMTLAVLLFLSTVIWVRWSVGLFMVPLLGAMILAIATGASPSVQVFAIQFLGVQACISTFHQMNYLFSSQAAIGGQIIPSDTGVMARALWLPYWFWGGLMLLTSLAILVQSLRYAYRV